MIDIIPKLVVAYLIIAAIIIALKDESDES